MGAQMRNVSQAGAPVSGRPAVPATPPSYSRSRDVMLSVARRESGHRGEFARDTVNRANAAFRSGDEVRARSILATGLSTFFPTRVAASSDESASKSAAMHTGWQANLGRGVTALIAHAERLLGTLQFDADIDIVNGDASRDALLDSIRKDGGITAVYRQAITNADALNNEGRHDEALAVLRADPTHQDIMAYFAAPDGAPDSRQAFSVLSAWHIELHRFQTLVNGESEVPDGAFGAYVSYARENPNVLQTRALVQSVGADLYRIGAYRDARETVRPLVPPRIVAGSAP